MAFLSPIHKPQCQASGCSKRATDTLVNFRNSNLGHYCRKHGERALKVQAEHENEIFKKGLAREH